jgi:hypothetical protein
MSKRKKKLKLTQDTILTNNKEWALIKKGKKESITGTEDYWHVKVTEFGKPNGEQYSLYVVDDFKNQKQWEPLLDKIDFETAVLATGELHMVKKKKQDGTSEVVINADCKLDFAATMNKQYYLSEDWKSQGVNNAKQV